MGMLTINSPAGIPWGRPDLNLASSTANTQVLSATNNGIGTIFLAPKTGNLSKIGFLVTAQIGTIPTYRASIQGVSGRAPDGTVKGSGTAKHDDTVFATGWNWFSLDTPLAVTAGQELCLVLTYQSGTVNASNCITVSKAVTIGSSAILSPYAIGESAGSWTVAGTTSPPTLSAQYDDGTCLAGCCAYSSLTNAGGSWNNSTGALYRGTKWTVPADVRIIGAMVIIRAPTGANLILNLFLGSASTPAVSTTVTVNNDFEGTVATNAMIPLPPTVVTAGTVVRLVVQPTTATTFTAFVSATMADAASLSAWWGDLSGTQGTSATPPVWTDAALDAYPVIPIIDQIASYNRIIGG